MMLPVQPMPTMTASTSFNRVAICPAPSREVRDGLRLHHVPPVAGLLHHPGADTRRARRAAPPRAGLVAVAAIERIGEEALHCDGEQRLEELLAVEILERSLARL